MKHFRNLLTALVTMATALAMATPALASTVTITSQDKAGHTYGAYQIFKGDVVTKDGSKIISNVEWGADFNGKASGLIGELNSTLSLGLATDATASDVVDALTAANIGDDSAAAQSLADILSKYTDGTPSKTSTGTTPTFNLDITEDGYYFVKDEGTLAENGTATRFVLGLIDAEGANASINAKNTDVPSNEKKIKDTNDTTGDTSDWQDSADYDLGDAVPYQLGGSIPTQAAEYKTYNSKFQDVLSKGLTFNNDVKVYVADDANGTNKEELPASEYTVTTRTSLSLVDGQSAFEVALTNAKKYAGKTILVEYTATLNDQAVYGVAGNPNKSRIVYSTNPNEQGGGTPAETPWDNVIVFTYKAIFNKVDGAHKPLTGADFTLYKLVKQADGTTKEVEVVKKSVENGTRFSFSGLDDGEYVLKETKTPDGYNKIDDKKFTVTAEHKILFDGLDWETGQDGTKDYVLASLKAEGKGIEFTSDTARGTVESSIVNKKGLELPMTGDVGITALYVSGGLLALGAAVLLVARRIARSER